MSKKNLLSVVIPCRNQGEVLGKTLEEISNCGKELNYQIEIIVSDGNSTDNTSKVLSKYAKKYSNLIYFKEVLTKKGEHGKGNGLKQGIAKTKGDLVLFMDADNSTKFSEIKKLLRYIDKYQLVIGTRY